MQVTACDICSEPVGKQSLKVLTHQPFANIDLCYECSTAIRELLEKHELIIKSDLPMLSEPLL